MVLSTASSYPIDFSVVMFRVEDFVATLNENEQV